MSAAQTKDSRSQVCVIALGNLDRGDDAAAMHVMDQLAQRNLEADFEPCSGDSMSLINLWREYQSVILLDVLAPAGRPGNISRFEICEELLDTPKEAPSSHMPDLPQAWHISKTLGTLPKELVLFAIEGQAFDLGAPMSEGVKRAIPQFGSLVVQEIQNRSMQVTEVTHA